MAFYANVSLAEICMRYQSLVCEKISKISSNLSSADLSQRVLFCLYIHPKIWTHTTSQIHHRRCPGLAMIGSQNRKEGNDQESIQLSQPPIRDIKGKETQTRNNWTLMETSLAESQRTVTLTQSGQMAIQNKKM